MYCEETKQKFTSNILKYYIKPESDINSIHIRSNYL